MTWTKLEKPEKPRFPEGFLTLDGTLEQSGRDWILAAGPLFMRTSLGAVPLRRDPLLKEVSKDPVQEFGESPCHWYL